MLRADPEMVAALVVVPESLQLKRAMIAKMHALRSTITAEVRTIAMRVVLLNEMKNLKNKTIPIKVQVTKIMNLFIIIILRITIIIMSM